MKQIISLLLIIITTSSCLKEGYVSLDEVAKHYQKWWKEHGHKSETGLRKISPLDGTDLWWRRWEESYTSSINPSYARFTSGGSSACTSR